MATLRRASGLVTFSSEINKREGALEVAENVVIDAEDTIESRRGFTDFGAAFGASVDRISQLLTYKARVLRHYNSTLEFDSTGSGSFSTFAGTYDELEDGLRIKSFESKGNLYFTTNDGVKKISVKSPSEFSTASDFITNAGGVKAVDVEAALKFTDGGFLSADSKCAYRVVWGIRDPNNNLILGTPSPRVLLVNNSQDIKTAEEFDLTFTSGTVTDYDGTTPDRYILINSSTAGYYIWFSSTAFPSPPQDAPLVGRISLEVDIEGLSTSADIAIATANVITALSEFTAEVNGSIIIVTSTESGENLTDPSISVALTTVVLTIVEQGDIAKGRSANADITITIPSEITSTDYFYQLYRTANITATTEVALEFLDPGDEMNLAFESNLTDAEISAGEVVFEDITTEEFRSSGAFLYTNPNTGGGILQSNEKPPVATDVALFRNTAFYGNTRTAHRKQFNFISVANMTSASTKLIIGNEDGVVEYTFVGETEVTDVTCDSFANTTDTGYILLNSARDERKYYIWFDKGSTTDPAVANRVGLRVSIETGDTADDVATKLSTVLNFINDFDNTVLTDTVTITNIKNGNTTDASIGAALGGAWAVAVTTQGDGEDSGAKEVLLSSSASVGQAIEESSLSLVKVINKDSASPVNAFYLSGADDVPGILFFESKTLEDKQFFVGTNDAAITGNFNPDLTVEKTITVLSAASPTQITSTTHGLATGTNIFLYSTDATPAPTGKFETTFVDANNFTIPFEVLVAGTTGKFFEVNFESDNEVAPNRLFYSKVSQPESVPIVNFIDIGPKDKAIKRILALRDNLFVLKEDAIYIVTGTTAPNFSSRLLDNSTQITAPDSAALLNNKIYCLTTQGVTTVTEAGVQIISRPIEDRILKVTTSDFDFSAITFGVSYETDRAYFLWLPESSADTVATQCYRYNTFTNTWTRWTTTATSAIVNSDNDKLYIGLGDRNITQEERKKRDRTDYSDRDFTLSIPSNSVDGASIIMSSVSDLDLGDVVLQDQYVTIKQYNRLLLKLDLDTGLTDTDYSSSLAAVSGNNMETKLTDLNTKLSADDSSGTVTTHTFTSDFATQQTEFNLLIAELNTPACDTKFKTYKTSDNTISYEVIVTAIDKAGNVITVVNEIPFLEGPVTIFKGIEYRVQWAPQHFGQPETMKQVREGTIIFDQNNFYSGTVSYATDRSANFAEVDFLAGGRGFWGGFDWGESIWGGSGNEVPLRTLLPQDKQRCRHVKVRFKHINARENVRILGVSLEPRVISTRAYR